MKKTLLTSSLFLLLFSCTENKPENKLIVENAVENAESKSYSRYSKGQNIIDGIYNEQIKDDEKLKDFQKRFLSIQNDSEIMKHLYDDITRSSQNYYSDAETRAKNIMDSTLQKEVLNLLKNSSEKYDTKINKLNALKIQINLNFIELNSFYDAYKIKKTLPEIEKYQDTHPLKTDSLENFVNKQNQLLEELKKLK